MNKKVLTLLSGILILFVSLFIFAQTFEADSPQTKGRVASKERKSEYKTITPTLLEYANSNLVIGTVLSNETANVYARREGIVQDVLVDIGDEVKAQQIIGLLLPQGVEGLSDAKIAEKNALLNKAQIDYENAKNVRLKAVDAAKQKLEEKKVALDKVVNDQDAITELAETVNEMVAEKESAKLAVARQNIEVAKTNLQTIEDNLREARKNQKNVILKAQSDADQKVEQAELAVVHARQTVELIFTLNAGRVSEANMTVYDIPLEIGVGDETNKSTAIRLFNELIKLEETLSVLDLDERTPFTFEYLDKGIEMLDTVDTLVQRSITSINLSRQDITSMAASVHAAQSRIFKAKEDLEDAYNGKDVVFSREDEKIVKLENSLKNQKALLKSARESYEVAKSDQNKNTSTALKELQKTETQRETQINLLNEQVKTAENSLNLVVSQQEQLVANAKNTLSVVRATYGAELAASGHQEIRSPFEGVVSKRFIGVGDVVMSSQPVFELVDVQTTLAQKAKTEVQFGVPENLSKSVRVGDEIKFFIATSESEFYVAEITRISPQVDEMTHTVTVQAKIDDDVKLPHHASVRGRITNMDNLVYRVPSSSVKRKDNENYVWILDDSSGNPIQTLVTVFAEDGEFAEIGGDIDEGTQIVVDPSDLIKKNLTKKDDK